MAFWSGSVQEYKLFPSALTTRAIDWVAVKADGGVEVSSAAANTLRLGRGMMENAIRNRALRSWKVRRMLQEVEVERGILWGGIFGLFGRDSPLSRRSTEHGDA